jgi:tetratricopeptide (TPR) repeat protein
MRFSISVSCLFVMSFVCGCATRSQKALEWDRDSAKSISAFQQEVVPLKDLNYPLHELGRGLLFFENGDFYHSDSRFANALKVMDRVRENKGQETGAVVWDERAKVFKGEPYERATAHFYRGLCHFNTGDYAGALAAFRSSLASDAETRNKEARLLEDFTISQFMAALCYSRLGEPENAEAALRLARANCSKNPFLTSACLKHNFIAIIGTGLGPYKVGARKWAVLPALDQRIELLIDGTAERAPVEATDLLVQAKSQTWGAADSARIARQAGKLVLSAVLSGVAGTNVNIEDYADTRCWFGLPQKYYVFTAAVPPGNHTILMKAYDKKGKEIDPCRQIWFDVPVPAEQAPVLLLRIRLNAQNCLGLQALKIEPQNQESGTTHEKGEKK